MMFGMSNGGKEIGMMKGGFFVDEFKHSFLGNCRVIFWSEIIANKNGEFNIIEKVGTLYEYHIELGKIVEIV